MNFLRIFFPLSLSLSASLPVFVISHHFFDVSNTDICLCQCWQNFIIFMKERFFDDFIRFLHSTRKKGERMKELAHKTHFIDKMKLFFLLLLLLLLKLLYYVKLCKRKSIILRYIKWNNIFGACLAGNTHTHTKLLLICWF